MAYTLAYSGGTLTVNDGSLNTQTSLAFPGRNYAGYGTYVDQNMLSMLENFASSTSGPSNAIRGQIWFDANNNRLKYNVSTTLGTPSWRESVTSGIGQDISVRNITMADSGGTVNGVLTTRAITTGSTATSGTLTGQWTLPVGSSLSGNIVIPTASTTQLGGVKVDGTTITINGSGVISAVAGSGGGVTQIVAGSNISISSTGNPLGTGIVTINAFGTGGGGGVSSVAVTSGDMTVTGSPITGAGTIGLSLNTVPISKGGTGQTTASGALNALLPSQSGNSGALLTTNGTNASWAQFPSSASLNGYTTLPGGIVMAWGSVNFGDIYFGHDTETISFGGVFSQVYNVQVQLQRNTPGPGTGAAYPIITDNLTTSGFTVYLQETTSGNGPYTIWWSAIGSAAVPGAPTGLNFTTVWSNEGPTSTAVFTGSVSGGTGPFQYDWSINGGATYPITNTNPASFSGIDNGTVTSLSVRMRVRNSVSPGGVTFNQTVTNSNYPSGGGGSDPTPITCFPAGSKVLMADGSWNLIENIVVGDYVMSPDGPVPVVDVHLPILGNRKLLSFADNSIKWSEEHLFWTKDFDDKQWWWSFNPEAWLHEVESGEVIGLKDNSTLRGPEIPVKWAHLDGWRSQEIIELESDYWTQLYLPITNGAPIIVDGYLVTAGANEFKYDYTKIDWNLARQKIHDLLNTTMSV